MLTFRPLLRSAALSPNVTALTPPTRPCRSGLRSRSDRLEPWAVDTSSTPRAAMVRHAAASCAHKHGTAATKEVLEMAQRHASPQQCRLSTCACQQRHPVYWGAGCASRSTMSTACLSKPSKCAQHVPACCAVYFLTSLVAISSTMITWTCA